MHDHRLREVARAMVSAVLLVMLLIGVPLVLVRFAGWPLPREVPNLTELGHALGGPSISDGVLVKTLAVIAWLGWVEILACRAWSKLSLGSLAMPRTLYRSPVQCNRGYASWS